MPWRTAQSLPVQPGRNRLRPDDAEPIRGADCRCRSLRLLRGPVAAVIVDDDEMERSPGNAVSAARTRPGRSPPPRRALGSRQPRGGRAPEPEPARDGSARNRHAARSGKSSTRPRPHRGSLPSSVPPAIADLYQQQCDNARWLCLPKRAGGDGKLGEAQEHRRDAAAVRRSAHLDGRREDIAAAAYGLDHARVLRIVFELAAQPADLHVDRAVERPGFAIARQIQQAVARQYLVGVVDERREQVELAGRQPDFVAARRQQLAARQVEVPAGEAHARARGCGISAVRSWARRSTALTRASSSRRWNGFGR